MIREMSVEETGEIAALFEEAFSGPPWNDRWSSREAARQYILDIIDNKNAVCVGYYRQDEFMGLALCQFYRWWEGLEVFIKEFCIAASHQNRGYGKEFMAELEDYLREKGVVHVTLLTERDVPACTFYRQLGFREMRSSVYFVKKLAGD